jgi:hypothetical protein
MGPMYLFFRPVFSVLPYDYGRWTHWRKCSGNMLINMPVGGALSEWSITSWMYSGSWPGEHRLSVNQPIGRNGGDECEHTEGMPDVETVAHARDESLGVRVREDRRALW